jgi:hypothetical protein
MPGMRPWGNQPLEVWISGTDVPGGGGGGGEGGQVEVTNWPTSQAVTGSVNATCTGTVSVSGSVAVTGTFWQNTQPVSLAACPLPTGAATSAAQGTGNTSLGNIDTKTPALGQATMANSRPVVIASNQSAVPVSGTFWQATQPVSGTFWQATQPVSIASPVPVTGTFWQATQPVSGPLTDAQLRASPVPISGNLTSAPQASTLCVTNTAAAAAACTLTLPAIAGQFHHISHLTITRYATAAVTGTATPILVTSTNLPGSPVWTFARAQAIGTTDIQTLVLPGAALKSSVANTATTIVCPATTSVLWRVTAVYYGAP